MPEPEPTPAGGRYSYYGAHHPAGLDPRRVAGARWLSEARLRPALKDLDYLVLRHRARILAKWFDEISGTASVLDVGGRIQPYRSLLGARIGRYVAVDLQLEGFVDVVATGECLPFAENEFDVVLCNQTLHYIPEPDIAVNEMHRVLRPGGRLLLTTPSLMPEHHDHLWRFLPDGLRYLTRRFSTVEIVAEGCSAAGLVRAANITLHRDLKNHVALRVAEKTTIPIINVLGRVLDTVLPRNTRSTANYCVKAVR